MNDPAEMDGIDPRHFAYATPNMSVLRQGDILRRSSDLIDVIAKWHPYFAKEQYRYFQILTQSCNLEQTDGRDPISHITLAAVRSVDEAISREARRHQEWWMSGLRCISDKNYDKLTHLVARLIDNIEPGYFYFPEETEFGISGDNCTFLRLSIALKNEHFEICRRAKIAELRGEFQAKLGWNVGALYNQVGTPGWDDKYGPNSREKLAAKLTKQVVKVHSEEKIRLAMKTLSEGGRSLRDCRLEDFQDALNNSRPKKPKTQFTDSATLALAEIKFLSKISTFFSAACMNDIDNESLLEHLHQSGHDVSRADLKQLVADCWKYWIKEVCTDSLGSRGKIVDYLAKALAADPALGRYIK